MRRFVILSIGLLVLAGCGSKKAPSGIVSGNVTYKGKPVNGAALMLHPSTGSSIAIPVSQEGAYRAADLPEGEYKVVVQPSEGNAGVPSTKGMDPAKVAEMQSKIDAMKTPPTIPIPEKYKQLTTTDLKLNVAKGEQTINLELKD